MPRKKWTDEALINDAARFSSIKEWMKGSASAYTISCARGAGFHARATAHMQRETRKPYTDDELIADASKYKTIKEWQKAPGGAYQASYGRGPDFLALCTAHMESKANQGRSRIWTKEACLKSALRFQSRRDWEKGEAGAYVAAGKNGWREECTAHMERLMRLPFTDDELLESARRYDHIIDWMRSDASASNAARKRGDEFFSKCVTHMTPADSNCDYDALYCWEWIEDGVGTGIYKVGITSWRLNDRRIKECTSNNGIDYRLIGLCQTSPGGAKEFEKALLELGDKVALPDHITDGRTEFRIYNDEELGFIYELLGVKEAQAEAA